MPHRRRLPGDGTVLVRARSGTDITAAYPELLPLADILGRRAAVLGGEIVALDDRGTERLGAASAAHGARRFSRQGGVHGCSGARAPDALRHRAPRQPCDRPAVRGVARTPGRSRTGRTGQVDAQGLLANRLTPRYEPGVRSKSWIKIRFVRTADVVVGGWVPGRSRLARLPGTVLVVEQLQGQLHYAGSVGTGWSRAERTRLAGLLHVADIDTCPFAEIPPVTGAQWVLSRLVGEVGYSTRTRAGRLCHPSWHRLRSGPRPRRPHLIPRRCRAGRIPVRSGRMRLRPAAHYAASPTGWSSTCFSCIRPETTLPGSSVCQKE